MNGHMNLNQSSPIVQRVLRLRERRARNTAMMAPLSLENHARSSDVLQAEKSHQWQMWQKSDLTAYLDDEPGYRCKG